MIGCKIEGCENIANRVAMRICEKHYARFYRTGSYELRPKSKQQTLTAPNGYIKVARDGHPLADKYGYVFEHRLVYFEEVDSDPKECELCKAPGDWRTLHIDHIDNNRINNNKENLRALCRACNCFRGHTATSMGKNFLTVNGVTMSASAWSRMPGVRVTASTISRRHKLGYSDYEAVYAEKVTHKSKETKKIARRYDNERGINPVNMRNG